MLGAAPELTASSDEETEDWRNDSPQPMLGYNSIRFWTEATDPHRLRSHCVYWVPSDRLSATPLDPLSPGSAHLAMALPPTPTSISLFHAVKEKQHMSWGGKAGSRLQAGARVEISGRMSDQPGQSLGPIPRTSRGGVGE